jgi:hypothetical protein
LPLTFSPHFSNFSIDLFSGGFEDNILHEVEYAISMAHLNKLNSILLHSL